MKIDPSNVYSLTIDKLLTIIDDLEECLETQDWEKAEVSLEKLRDYKNCFYCKVYRKSLEVDGDGFCDKCPCHMLGEKISGRPRGCNGCYVMECYRSMVHNSHWFSGEQSEETLKACIKSIEDTLNFMQKNKVALGG